MQIIELILYYSSSESVTFEKFKWLRETRGMHSSPSLLCGNLDTGTKFMLGTYEFINEYLVHTDILS